MVSNSTKSVMRPFACSCGRIWGQRAAWRGDIHAGQWRCLSWCVGKRQAQWHGQIHAHGGQCRCLCGRVGKRWAHWHGDIHAGQWKWLCGRMERYFHDQKIILTTKNHLRWEKVAVEKIISVEKINKNVGALFYSNIYSYAVLCTIIAKIYLKYRSSGILQEYR